MLNHACEISASRRCPCALDVDNRPVIGLHRLGILRGMRESIDSSKVHALRLQCHHR